MINIIIKKAQDLEEFEIDGMARVMSQGYYQSKMDIRFHEGLNQNVKQLCAYAKNNDEIVGACVVKEHQSLNRHPVSNDYPSIYFKHMSVQGDYQSRGIGSELVRKMLNNAYDYFNTHIIWSETAELGALKFYHRQEAWFFIPSIESVNSKTNPEDNTKYLEEMMQNSNLNKWRLPNDVIFAWVNDNDIAQKYLASHNYKKNVWQSGDD